MSDPTQALDSFGNAKFTEDFRSEVNYNNNREDADTLQRNSTLKKKSSFKRERSVRRSRANSAVDRDESNPNSILHVPIPTQNTPTEVLAQRFQAWRRLLKDYIDYFKEVQSANEIHSKSLLKLSQTISNQSHGTAGVFMREGGILETNNYLRNFHSDALSMSENSRTIENEIIKNLVGLRGDLALKIKEIKALAGDFKSSVEKEKEATRRSLAQLNEAIQTMNAEPTAVSGKNEPYIARLQVEKQIKKQLAEENYLHRAYLNLEQSGRELEKIVVGEIQKAFGTYSQIIRREGLQMIQTSETMDRNIVQIPQDIEWSDFIERDPNMVDPKVAMRTIESIQYPGLNHPSTVVVRQGQLERRTKYLKSYTPGWYVLSSTHLHEFKTADRASDLTPIMSLYLPECTVGSFSDPAAVSHKFVMRGRQAGALHTRHSWTFRAESHAIMLEWYEDIKKLTNLSGGALNAFIATRVPVEAVDPEDTVLLENDEADQIPYSSTSFATPPVEQPTPVRPEVGRFPSDIQLARGFAESNRPASSGSDRSVGGGYTDRRASEGWGNDRYVVVSANLLDPNNPKHHSRSPSTTSFDDTHLDDSPAHIGANSGPVNMPSPVIPITSNVNSTTNPAPPMGYEQGNYTPNAANTTATTTNTQNPQVNFIGVGSSNNNLGQVPENSVAAPPVVGAGGSNIPARADIMAAGRENAVSGGKGSRETQSISSISTRDIHFPGEYPRENY